MLTVLPSWTAGASIYPQSRYSYYAPSTGFPSAWAQRAGQPVPARPFAGLPCGTCGPCTQEETSPTGCLRSCWTRRSPDTGTCDEYDVECRGCPITCPPDYTLCGIRCINLNTDQNNCGRCGNVCPPGLDNAPPTCCNARCVDVSSDPNNCGKCGSVCTPGVCCSGGCCPPGSTCCGGGCCPSGWQCHYNPFLTICLPF
jgi:hypothetical protein